MKLITLVGYLKSRGSLAQLYNDEQLNEASEAIEVYMEEAVDLSSNIGFFEFEKTNGDITMHVDGKIYVSLFALVFVYEFVQETLAAVEKITDREIAHRLLEYRLKDA